MTATWLDLPEVDDGWRQTSPAGGLRVVGEPGGPEAPWVAPLTVVPDIRHGGARRRRSSPAVRRRRALLAAIALLLIALALPLSGTGGYSHPAGSALAESRGPVVYTVHPGDSLWSIAERLEPAADPRPLVAKLAAQTGSETVTPGERILLP